MREKLVSIKGIGTSDVDRVLQSIADELVEQKLVVIISKSAYKKYIKLNKPKFKSGEFNSGTSSHTKIRSNCRKRTRGRKMHYQDVSIRTVDTGKLNKNGSPKLKREKRFIVAKKWFSITFYQGIKWLVSKDPRTDKEIYASQGKYEEIHEHYSTNKGDMQDVKTRHIRHRILPGDEDK